MPHALAHRLLFTLLMSSAMSLVMTGWISWLNQGFSAAFLQHWLRAIASAWPVAFGAVWLLAPPVQCLTHALLRAVNATTSPVSTSPARKG